MGKIHLLSEHEIHKIAAGEVVERPASAAKELLENALDAGATSITLRIKQGGKKLIQIIDNGCGMDRDDAYACLKNHATSKISSVDDIEKIATFGFRGEALAAITAVSRVTLKTRGTENNVGLQLTINGGTVVDESIVACPVGTDIAVEDLFFNVPARQKFLKKDETEWRALNHLFITCALQNHCCGFSLIHDDRTILQAPAVKTALERAAQLLGGDIAKDLLSCSNRYDQLGLSIEGIIARPNHHRYDKSHIFFFVNRRPVKNHKLVQALIKGYNNVLPAGQNPIGIVFITINPEEVDVNIHPRKEEVQFVHPVTVERCIHEMVQNALNNDVNLTTQVAPFDKATNISAIPPKKSFIPAKSWASITQNNPLHPPQKAPQSCVECSTAAQPDHPEFKTFMTSSTGHLQAIIEPSYTLLGQLLNTYLVIEHEDSLILIDQHAAHERVLYEKFAERFIENGSTQLIFPHIIKLNPEDALILSENLSTFAGYGMEIEPFGPQSFAIRAVPVYLKSAPFDEIVRSYIDMVDGDKNVSQEEFNHILHEKLRALMACKAAVKAGDRLTPAEMHELIEKLMACEQKTTCPHGRPTMYRLNHHEIEKIFQRCG